MEITLSCWPLLVWGRCQAPLQPVSSAIQRIILPNPLGVPWELGPNLGPGPGSSRSQLHHGFLGLPSQVGLPLPAVTALM